MKKMILISTLLALFISIGFTFTITELKKDSAVNIGKKIVIEKDTLLITDYSLLESNYTLSNGKKVSFELIKKIPLIK